jgi:hypothetical protein
MGFRDERLPHLGAPQGAQELDAKEHVRDEQQIRVEESLELGALGLGENDLGDG